MFNKKYILKTNSTEAPIDLLTAAIRPGTVFLSITGAFQHYPYSVNTKIQYDICHKECVTDVPLIIHQVLSNRGCTICIISV